MTREEAIEQIRENYRKANAELFRIRKSNASNVKLAAVLNEVLTLKRMLVTLAPEEFNTPQVVDTTGETLWERRRECPSEPNTETPTSNEQPSAEPVPSKIAETTVEPLPKS